MPVRRRWALAHLALRALVKLRRPFDVLQEPGALAPFAALPERARAHLFAEARVESVEQRIALVQQGEPVKHLQVLLEGCVELCASAGGRESTLDVLRPGDHFVLAAVIEGAPSPVCARTCAPSRVLRLPAGAVREAFDADAAFARAVAHELAHRCTDLFAAHADIKLHSAVVRLAERLLRYDAEQGAAGSIVLPCDKRTLASLLTMTPENLSRALKSLRPYGVRVRGATIELTDVGALAELTDPPLDGDACASTKRAREPVVERVASVGTSAAVGRARGEAC